MLWSAAAIDTATQAVVSEDFADAGHQAIFHATITVAHAGRAVAASSVADQLRRDGTLAAAGGIDALVVLQAEASASVSATPHYAAIVADQAQRRRIRAAATELIDATRNPVTSPAELADLAAKIGAGSPRRDEPLPVVWVHESLASPPIPPPVVVEQLLRRGEMLALAAARSVGKTWGLQGLALHLADGYGRWLDTFAVRQPSRVLYWHGEADEWGTNPRWARLVGENQTMSPRIVDCYEPTRLRVSEARTWLADGTMLTSYRATIDPRFEATIEAVAPDVFVIDPWASFYGGNENDNAAVSAAVDELWRLCRRYQCALVVAHHFSKVSETREPEDLWRGASRLADAAHTRITLLPYYTPTDAKRLGLDRHQARRHARVTFLRRNDRIPDDITVRWDPDSGLWRKWEDPDALGEADTFLARERMKQRSKARGELSMVIDAARRLGGGFSSLRTAMAAFGCSHDKAERLLELGCLEGILEPISAPGDTSGRARSWVLKRDVGPSEEPEWEDTE